MAVFLRQLYKQKPQQWGPFDYVQGCLFERAAKIGFDPEKIELAMPMWNPGDQRDYSKNGLIGTNNGATFDRNSLSFDGINDYVQFPDTTLNNICNGYNDFSILLTANTYKFPSSTAYTISPIAWGMRYLGNVLIVIGDSAPVDAFSLRTQQNGSWTSPVISSTIEKEVFYHVCVTYNANSGWTISLDGEQQDTSTQTGSIGRGTTYRNWVGGMSGYSSRYWDGYIENIFLINTVLTQDQISFLSDNPYYLWQPYRRMAYFVPTQTPNPAEDICGVSTYSSTLARRLYLNRSLTGGI